MRSVMSLFAPLRAADLTGHWLASVTTPDGQVRETSLYLTAQGDGISGYFEFFNQDPAQISNAKLSGNDLSFTIVRDNYGEQRSMNFALTLVGEELTMHLPGPNGSTREVVLKHVSAAVPSAMPAPKPKITLPAAPDVPYNGLAKTPPMGWNSWNKFAGKVTDHLVRETADAMAGNGMKAAGYEYINIDDTWEAGRDAQGNIQTNDKFPDMKALADYVHSKGLKLGIYSSPGPKTCAGYEGSLGHEGQDAKTYASWGIDYLKYDWCSAARVYDYHSMPAAYAKMGKALHDSGRAIVYSLCQYGLLNSSEWGPKVGGNSWRTTGDIRDSWTSMSHIGFDLQLPLTQYAGPGHWNDPDMLEIGNGGMSDLEYRTHMSLWSLLAAPLLAGNDLRSVPTDILAILTNKEVIAIDQDKLGKEAARVAKNGDTEIWARPLADGSYAVGLFNRGAEAAKVTANWSDIGIKGKAQVRDLWKHSDEGEFADSFSADVPSHGVVLVNVGAK
jgi:alpha-galactosidase